MSSDAVIGPIKIRFPDGMNNVEVEAYSKEGVDSLSQPKYSYGTDDVTLSAPKYS